MSQLQVTGEAKIREIQGPVVANDGVITALDGAANQYVRGDGTLASFPTSGGGGSSVSYYLNGSVNQGTFGGSTYYQMSKEAITGLGTNFSTSSDGLLAQFITDVNVPDVTEIPSGNWNLEFFMNVSASSGALASFYAEIYKWNGTTFTLIATNVATPEQLTNTTTIDAYFTSVAMPTTALSVTDRIAIRIYANVAGKTVTLYTENNRLCQVITTFSRGVTSINNLTDQSQYLTVGTSGTNFNIASSGDTHTFNLPIASATNTGKLSSTDWSIFNNKVPYTGANANVNLGTFALNAGAITTEAGYAFKILTAGTLFQNGYSVMSSLEGNISLTQAISAGNLKAFTFDFSAWATNTSRTFTLPNASGTLALTSDIPSLAGYVPYTGATTNVNLGTYALDASTITAIGLFATNTVGTNAGILALSIGSTFLGYVGHNTIAAAANGVFVFTSDISSGAAIKDARFNFGSLTNNTTRTFTFPNASGTIALTSDIPSLANYVTLDGTQTISGAKTFSAGTVFSSTTSHTGTATFGAGSPTAFDGTDGTLIIPKIRLYSSNPASIYSDFVSAATSNRSIVVPDASGTLALTSNLSAYLPLSGGTLTGALGGTSASFSSTATATAFIPTGSTIPTNGMYLSAANTLNFATNTTNRLSISSTGLVTITNNLLVAGSIESQSFISVSDLEGSVRSDFFTTYSSGTTSLTFLYNTAGSVVWANNSTKMSLSSAGNLVVVGSLTAASLSNGTNNYTFPSANGTLVLGTGTNNYISKFTSTGSTLGNSGIFDNGTNVIFGGTSNTSANPTVVMQNRLGTVLSVAGFNWAGTTTDNNSVNSLMVIGGYLNTSAQTVATATNASGMQFFNGGFYWYGNSGLTIGSVYTNTQRMFLTVGGNLIIGSGADAGFRLDVSGTARLTGALTATSGTFSSTLTMSAYSYADSALQFRRAATNTISPASGNGIMVFSGGSSQIRINTNNAICFDMNNGGTPYTSLLLSQNGNTVLINSPDNTLSLGLGYQGTYHGFLGGFSSALYAYSTNGGQVYLTSGSAWVPVSDANRKKNFETYNLGLNAILGLEAKLYHMDFQEDSEEKQVGLIAQQVREHIPQAFEQNDKFIGLNYNVIIVTLVNAIQELKAEIDILKNK